MRSDLVRIDVVRAVLFRVPFRGRGCESRPGAEFVFSFYCRGQTQEHRREDLSSKALRLSAYSLEFELGLVALFRRERGARKRKTVLVSEMMEIQGRFLVFL